MRDGAVQKLRRVRNFRSDYKAQTCNGINPFTVGYSRTNRAGEHSYVSSEQRRIDGDY